MSTDIESYTRIINTAEASETEKTIAYYNRGNAKGKLGKYDEAIKDYDKAIARNPDDAKAYCNRGLAKQVLGKHEEAIKDYDKAIEFKPAYADAHNNRGTVKWELGKYDEAIKDYDKAIARNPDHADAHNNRGTAKWELGKYDEAIANYTEAIKHNPNLAKAYSNRGTVKGELGEDKEAIEDYDKAIKLNPNDAMVYFNRGNAKGILGWDGANEDYRKAIDMQCKHARKYYALKTCYKFILINKNTIDMLVKDKVYFSDVPSLNDPLECPLLKSQVFREAFKGDYQPRILSLVVPPPSDETDENEIHQVVNNTLLFSHYADAHKGICIAYEIDKAFLGQGKMFYTRAKYSKDTMANSLQQLFAIKDERWEYEDEGRFVAFGKENLYTLNKGTTRITKIIFGLETTNEDKELLWKLLRGKEPEIEFFNTRNDTEGQYFDFKFEEYTEDAQAK